MLRKILPFIQESRLASIKFVLKICIPPLYLFYQIYSPVFPWDQTGFLNKISLRNYILPLYTKKEKRTKISLGKPVGKYDTLDSYFGWDFFPAEDQLGNEAVASSLLRIFKTIFTLQIFWLHGKFFHISSSIYSIPVVFSLTLN